MILLYLLQVALLAPNAQADHPGVGAFNVSDGNTAGDDDWDSVDPAFIEAYNIATHADLCGNGVKEDRIQPNTKLSDDPWPVKDGQDVGQKGDICRVWTAWHLNTDGDVILYVAWLRDSNTGEVSVYLPLEAAPAGHSGDLLVQFDYSSDQKSIDVRALEWNTTSWIETANPTEVSSVSENTLFAEVAFNLSTA
ncbi:MAG: hypothetical protein ACLGHX_03140, partial [Acidimicrobiia bacterium]